MIKCTFIYADHQTDHREFRGSVVSIAGLIPGKVTDENGF